MPRTLLTRALVSSISAWVGLRTEACAPVFARVSFARTCYLRFCTALNSWMMLPCACWTRKCVNLGAVCFCGLGAHLERLSWASKRQALAQYHSEVVTVSSLRHFLAYHPYLECDVQVHGGRLSTHVTREWTLARCGHHPFPDGRSARHRAGDAGAQHMCLCGNPSCSLLHGLRVCPLFDEQRQIWRNLRSYVVDVAQLSNENFLRLIFVPQHPLNSRSSMAAHVHFVAL